MYLKPGFQLALTLSFASAWVGGIFSPSHANPSSRQRPGQPYGDVLNYSRSNTAVPQPSVHRHNRLLAPTAFPIYSMGVGEEYFGVTTQRELDRYKDLTGKEKRLEFKAKLAKAANAALRQNKFNTFIASQLKFTEDYWKAASPKMAYELRTRQKSDVAGECWRQKLLLMCLLGGMNSRGVHFTASTETNHYLLNNVAAQKLLALLEERNKPLSDKEIAKAFESVMDLDGKAQ